MLKNRQIIGVILREFKGAHKRSLRAIFTRDCRYLFIAHGRITGAAGPTSPGKYTSYDPNVSWVNATRANKYAELGFRSRVHGAPTLDAA